MYNIDISGKPITLRIMERFPQITPTILGTYLKNDTQILDPKLKKDLNNLKSIFDNYRESYREIKEEINQTLSNQEILPKEDEEYTPEEYRIIIEYITKKAHEAQEVKEKATDEFLYYCTTMIINEFEVDKIKEIENMLDGIETWDDVTPHLFHPDKDNPMYV